MSVRHCSVCTKMLPESHNGSVCGLCSIGFTPVQNPQPALPLDQSRSIPLTMQGPAAGFPTGIEPNCLACGAELGNNDIRAGNCAICAQPISALQQGGFDALRGNMQAFDSDKGAGSDKEWPSEAPLW